jgi:hypothetical protein
VVTRLPQHPWINTSDAPVFCLTYPSYDPNDAEQSAKYKSELQSLYATLAKWTQEAKRHYAFVIDLSNIAESLAVNRQRSIKYLERIKKQGSPFLTGRAFVTPDNRSRGILTAVFWSSSPDYPHEFFETIAESKAWAVKQIEAKRSSSY